MVSLHVMSSKAIQKSVFVDTSPHAYILKSHSKLCLQQIRATNKQSIIDGDFLPESSL